MFCESDFEEEPFDSTKNPIIAAINAGTNQLNPKLSNGKLCINGTCTPNPLTMFNILTNNATYVENLNTLSFLSDLPNSVSTTSTIVVG